MNILLSFQVGESNKKSFLSTILSSIDLLATLQLHPLSWSKQRTADLVQCAVGFRVVRWDVSRFSLVRIDCSRTIWKDFLINVVISW